MPLRFASVNFAPFFSPQRGQLQVKFIIGLRAAFLMALSSNLIATAGALLLLEFHFRGFEYNWFIAFAGLFLSFILIT